MIKYIIQVPFDFSSLFQPFSIAMMKLIGSFGTELANIYLLCGQETVMDTIINFVALAGISQIDDLYYMSYKDEELKTRFSAVKPTLTKTQNDIKLFEKRFKNAGYLQLWRLHPGQMIIRAVYSILMFSYISFYFYFMPYLTSIITYLHAGLYKNS